MLTGKTAIVTGGSSGIGRAICARLQASGARVFNLDIAEPDNSDLFAQHLHCDISIDQQVIAAIDKVAGAAGSIDILVNNAGGAGSPLSLEAMTSSEWDQSMKLLLGAPCRMMTSVVPQMKRSGGGAIVNIASICGIQPGWGGAAYSTAKAALIHLTRIAAIELAGANIRVNSVSPGFIATPLFGRSRGHVGEAGQKFAEVILQQASGAQPLPVSGTPDDVAGMVAFLAGPEARFLTGGDFLVDGGLVAGPVHAWAPDYRSPVLDAITKAEASFARRERGA